MRLFLQNTQCGQQSATTVNVDETSAGYAPSSVPVLGCVRSGIPGSGGAKQIGGMITDLRRPWLFHEAPHLPAKDVLVGQGQAGLQGEIYRAPKTET